MVLNGAYLVEIERTEGLRRLLSELEERHRDVGARFELTGIQSIPKDADASGRAGDGEPGCLPSVESLFPDSGPKHKSEGWARPRRLDP